MGMGEIPMLGHPVDHHRSQQHWMYGRLHEDGRMIEALISDTLLLTPCWLAQGPVETRLLRSQTLIKALILVSYC